jgi:hypothetical protein
MAYRYSDRPSQNDCFWPQADCLLPTLLSQWARKYTSSAWRYRAVVELLGSSTPEWRVGIAVASAELHWWVTLRSGEMVQMADEVRVKEQ